MKVKPGMWETTVVVSGPMARTETSSECFTDGEWSADDLMDESAAMCSPSNVSVTDNSMSFDLNCSQQGMTVSGDMNFVSKGESGSGQMNMTISGAGMNMDLTVDMTSQWLGPC